tara:strand:+ start:54 stop:467 length:414 start_codon:yes stop_codon:yes gene_type:complete
MPPTNPKTIAFFAYGTLKRNRSNHDLLTGSRFIGKGVTAQKYGFYLGPDEQSLKGSNIPYLFKEPRKGDQAVRVYGEVWEVNEFTLNQLDQFEGHPNWYQRAETSVKLNSGENISSSLYTMPGQPDSHLRVITSGCF